MMQELLEKLGKMSLAELEELADELAVIIEAKRRTCSECGEPLGDDGICKACMSHWETES